MTTGTQNLTAIAQQFIDAFNGGDMERVETFVTPDIVYEETGTGRHTEGWDAYRHLLEGWRAALPDAQGDILRSVAQDDIVAQEIRWRATHTGTLQTPSGPIPATNRQADVSATVWYRFSGERVSEVRHHLDVLSLLGQLGVLPTPGG